MLHLALFLSLVWTAAVDARYYPTNAASERLALSVGRPLPPAPLADYQRLWRRLGEVSRPAASPEGLSRPWWVGQPATAGGDEPARRSDASGAEAELIGVRPTRSEHHQGDHERDVHLCGSLLVNFIESLCHGRRRRDVSPVVVRHLRSPLHRSRTSGQ